MENKLFLLSVKVVYVHKSLFVYVLKSVYTFLSTCLQVCVFSSDAGLVNFLGLCLVKYTLDFRLLSVRFSNTHYLFTYFNKHIY